MLHDAYVSSNHFEVSTLSAVQQPSDRKAILLATVCLNVADSVGDLHPMRVMIDQGSEVSIVSEALVQRLRLPRSRSAVSIIGIGGARTGSALGKVTLNLSSAVTGARFTAVAFILPRLSAYQGSSVKGLSSWSHVRGLELVDPRYFEHDPVELLLGAEICSTIFEDGLRKNGPRDPIAQKTALDPVGKK